MFSWHLHKENAELTKRFSKSENGRLMHDLPGIHPSVKLTVNEGFLAVWEFVQRKKSGKLNPWRVVDFSSDIFRGQSSRQLVKI